MKHVTRNQRLYMMRVMVARNHRRLRKLRKQKKRRKILRLGLNRHWWTHRITAPKIFSVAKEKHRRWLFDFLAELINTSDTKGARIYLQFKDTTHMVSDATLLFRAHLCRIRASSPRVVIRCGKSSTQRISEVLKQIGVFDALNQNINITPEHQDVVSWRYAQGVNVDGEKYEDVLKTYDGELSDALQRGLFVGLTEAMTNTKNHAYPNDIDPNRGDWWMFSQERNSTLQVSFCDLGVGIPKSLPVKHKNVMAKLISAVGMPKHSMIIDAAIEHSHTRTGKDHRGKGLKQLTDVVSKAKVGTLVIHSGNGCYTLKNTNKNLLDFKTPVNGTLISWSIPLI